MVIPTRNRAETLVHTLKTVADQSYENLEIIISDNASEDSTKEVINGYNDIRIKYTNTGKRVGMSENWEHGLSLVTGDYVMFLGDDDGLLPMACCDIAELLVSINAEAIIWEKPNYTWPSVSEAPNMLAIKFSNSLVRMRSDILLKAVVAGKTSYGRLPVIYSGFVSMHTINKIRNNNNGQFFSCVTPDVFSGIVIANELEDYLYSTRPFSINGGSKFSNGMSQSFSGNNLAKKFFEENALPICENFPIIQGSLSSSVAEAVSQASKRKLIGELNLNHNRHYENIYNDLLLKDEILRKQGLKILLELNITKALRRKVNHQLILLSKSEDITLFEKAMPKNLYSPSRDCLYIDCAKFDVKNSFDACQLAGNLLGGYKLPERIINSVFVSYVLLAISRQSKYFLKNYLLPF